MPTALPLSRLPEHELVQWQKAGTRGTDTHAHMGVPAKSGLSGKTGEISREIAIGSTPSHY